MNTPSPEDPVHPDTTLIQRLGYAGLIPFVGLALLLWLLQGEPQVFVSVALAAYAGLILSFLGGIHWGIGWLQAGRRDGLGVHFLWGVMPSLLAWPGVLMPPYAGLVWLGLVLYGASAVLWLWVLSRLDVSLAYPLVSLGFVVTMALGIAWLGEPFSWVRVGGCTLIVLGVSLLALDA